MSNGVTHEAQFQDMASFRRFALAGNAVFTMVSRRTGERFTYRLRRPQGDKKPLFCQVLIGPENTRDYAYFGLMFGQGRDEDFQSYRHGAAKARAGREAPSVRGFEWLVRNIMSDKVLEAVEIWHQGRCGKCRKALTVPQSILSGLGPVCAKGGRD